MQILPMKKKQINIKTSSHNSCSVSYHHHTWFLLLMASVVQSLSCVQLIATPWIAAYQASLFFTVTQSVLKPMSIESVMPSNHFILCHPLLPSIFPSFSVFPKDLALCIRWPKYWSFSFSISPSNACSKLISFTNWLVWSPCCSRDSQESSLAPQLKIISSYTHTHTHTHTLHFLYPFICWWTLRLLYCLGYYK